MKEIGILACLAILTYEEEEAQKNCSGCKGTGFFISDDGLIRP